MACQITINNQKLNFEEKSLTGRIARKIIHALNIAYMRSVSISCAPYVPTVQDEKHRYITACQLVHDNVWDITEGQSVRNGCLEKLEA